MPADAFHAALADAAIDLTGANKSQVGRLTRVPGDKIPIWGIPEIRCQIMKSSGIQRTPDVRTLPCLRRWATQITVLFPSALIKQQSIGNLLGSAGMIIGVGDGRPQKGKKANGCWRVCNENDEQWHAIVKEGGRKAQDAALADPEYYDRETEKLLTWFAGEKRAAWRNQRKPRSLQPKRSRCGSGSRRELRHVLARAATAHGQRSESLDLT